MSRSIQDYQAELHRMEDLVERQATEIKNLRSALASLQWAGDSVNPVCPSCRSSKKKGHHTKCCLAGALGVSK